MSAPEDSKTAIRPSDETAARPGASHPDSTARFTPGAMVAGRYRIVAPLGKGGMGEVYRADDVRLGQPVALKFLPAAFAADSSRLGRLVDEVRIGRQISHPNVCRLYDIGETEGHHFLVMEYVDGEDLASLLRRIGRLPGDKALEIGRGLCAGLAAAHDKGIIHRDLKPANVMIDGRGHARIADFGLAALADAVSSADMSGTPHYMAPEQLTGGGASLRSDVYSLGLVLHEMLTGKRVFKAKSLGELRALHAESSPSSLSSSGAGVDPGFDRVVLRCLAKDPASRPASAREVLLSLPGGDPLQAAILAGETPSPEMVAAAGRVGDLPASRAWLGLVAGLVGLLTLTALVGRTALHGLAPLPKSPEVLAERAREVLARVAHNSPDVDHAQSLFLNVEFLNDIERTDQSLNRWDRLRTARPGAFGFSYRQSPERMFSPSWIPGLPWQGPPDLGRITRFDPPLSILGMADVALDREGHLTRLAIQPPRVEETSGPWPEPDWNVLLAEAGLDPRLLDPSVSRLAAPVDSDRKAAWDGPYPRQAGVRFHVEAAAYHGRPVYFEVLGPFQPSPDRIRTSGATAPLAIPVAFGVLFLVIGALVVLVRRNVRMGRGDRRGAFRLGLFGFVAVTMGQVFRADHTGEVLVEYALLVQIVSQGCYAAIALWSFYMAAEPAVRRRWPGALISWSRLLAGRAADPLVGRDVLIGVLLGLSVLLVMRLGVIGPPWFGAPPPLGTIGVLTTLSSPRHQAYYLFLGSALAIVYAISLLLQVYLLHAVVGRMWLAQALLFSFVFLVSLATGEGTLVDIAVGALFSGLIVFAVTRLGLLSTTTMAYTFVVLVRTPLTLDASAWYAGRSFVTVGLFSALLIASAYLSLGGKPIFGKALLDD